VFETQRFGVLSRFDNTISASHNILVIAAIASDRDPLVYVFLQFLKEVQFLSVWFLLYHVRILPSQVPKHLGVTILSCEAEVFQALAGSSVALPHGRASDTFSTSFPNCALSSISS